jgi:uncharacterized protein YneF (UPF0154 family)
MLVPIAFLVLVLLVALAGGVYVARRRIIDHERKPDIRPDDREPTAHVSLE